MSRTYKGRGDRLQWANNTGAAVSSGDVVVLAGCLVCVALTDIASLAVGTVIVGAGEIHTLPATTAEAWGQGQRLYWNASTEKLTANPAAGVLSVGVAAAAKTATSQTTADIILAGTAAGSAGGSALDWQESVLDSLDFTAAEPAATPDVGARYINSGTGAGSVTAQAVVANQIAEWNGTDWTLTTPTEGMAVMDEDGSIIYIFTTSWVAIGTPDNLKDLTDGGNADALHVHATAGITAKAITVALLADAVQDLLPGVVVTAGAEAAHAVVITAQVQDAAGNSLAGRHILDLFVNASAAYAAPLATGTDTFGAPSAGAILETVTAKQQYAVVTDANGAYVFELTHNDAGSSRWVTARLGARAYASAEIALDAV